MNILTLDVETTISNKGNPFDQTNKLVCVGVKWLGENHDVYIKYDDFTKLQYSIDKADILVGFNIKFDLHWLRHAGINFAGKRIWDCQIGEFLLNNQLTPYPSLDGAAGKYGFDKKLDIVKTEYWDKGIDTDMIPREILSSYLEQDLRLTERVFLTQQALLKKENKEQLFKLHCLDLLVLQEMEWNGINFITEKARSKADELQQEIDGITKELSNYTGGIPFNPNSDDHVSCLLYGGTITIDDRIPVGSFKTGQKVGQTRYKIIQKDYVLPRLVDPIKGTERAKEGYWLTNADVLRSLRLGKESKKVVNLLNKYSELEKLRGTYLIGWSNLIDKMHWPKNKIHGTLNQTTVVTGRLSSTKPNLQNADPTTKIFCESIYGD